MSRLTAALIVCSSLGLFLAGCNAKKTPEEIREQGNKSVVLISERQGKSYGAGFVIEGAAGVCTVLTAKHVVPEKAEILIQTPVATSPWQPSQIRRAANADLAVLTFKPTDGNCPPALKLGSSQGLKLEQRVYISSYPGAIGGKPPTKYFYLMVVADTTAHRDGYAISYEAKTSGGTSGSPVFNDLGEVIAVHGRTYLEGNSAAVDAGIPIDIYKQDEIAKVDPTTASPNAQNKDDNSHKKTAKEYYQEGVAKRDNKEYQEAIELLDRAIQIDSNYADAYVVRGIAKDDLGKKEEAIADDDRAIQLNPNNSEAYYNRGLTKDDLGKKEEAIADDDRAIQLNPNNSEAYNNRGVAKSNLGKKEEAIADYDRAIQLNPKYSYAYIGRGNAKSALGKKEEAIADYNRAIQLDPNDSDAYYMRGESRKDLGNKQGAKEDYQKAAELYSQQKNDKWYQESLNRIKELGI